jgi:hypothetical protein
MHETTETPDESSGYSDSGDALHEAKAQAKQAARATLLAVRSAVDFCLSKLGDDVPGSNRDVDLAAPTGASQDEAGAPDDSAS